MQFLVDVAIRIPVPNDGACDWGLDNAGITASCLICKQYFDGRASNSRDPCVFVPGHGKCYPKKWAVDHNYEIDPCGEFQIQFYIF